MKICGYCNIEMKKIFEMELPVEVLKRKGDGFLISDETNNLYAEIYVCPKCGIIKNYIPENLLQYLDKIV